MMIVKNMQIPSPKHMVGQRGSKYDAALENVSDGDCILCTDKTEGRRLYQAIRKKGYKVVQRTLDDGKIGLWVKRAA